MDFPRFQKEHDWIGTELQRKIHVLAAFAYLEVPRSGVAVNAPRSEAVPTIVEPSKQSAGSAAVRVQSGYERRECVIDYR